VPGASLGQVAKLSFNPQGEKILVARREKKKRPEGEEARKESVSLFRLSEDREKGGYQQPVHHSHFPGRAQKSLENVEERDSIVKKKPDVMTLLWDKSPGE